MVVTGGALVRLMAVFWVVVVLVVVVVVVLVGGVLAGLSGRSGRVGGPRGGGGGTRPVVLEGARGGCLPGTGAWSLGLGAGGRAKGVLKVERTEGVFSSPVSVGETMSGGVGPRPDGGPELGGRDGGGRWVRLWLDVGVMEGLESRFWSRSLSLSRASKLV